MTEAKTKPKRKQPENCPKSPQTFLAKGESPNARFAKKLEKVCLWVFRWGFTSEPILCELLKAEGLSGSTGFAAKLVAGGWLKAVVPVRSLNLRKLYFLTPAGVDVARFSLPEEERDIAYPADARIPIEALHDLTTQSLTIAFMEMKRRLDCYTSGRILKATFDKHNEHKIVDAQWLAQNQLWLVEVELSEKDTPGICYALGELDAQIKLEQNVATMNGVSTLAIMFFRSESTMKKYARFVSDADGYFKKYARNANGLKIETQDKVYTDNLRNSLYFSFLKNIDPAQGKLNDLLIESDDGNKYFAISAEKVERFNAAAMRVDPYPKWID